VTAPVAKAPSESSAAGPAPRRAVLDSNTVLDWLVFGDPHGLAVGAAVIARRLQWLATAAMRDELAHVLARGHLEHWMPNAAALWCTWAQFCTEVPVPPPCAPALRLRCADPDDQKFIDLAIANPDCWLLTRDRAVLALARRLRPHGVDALTPAAWAQREPPG
jgi:predicted nucleic acid-binding protein